MIGTTVGPVTIGRTVDGGWAMKSGGDNWSAAIGVDAQGRPRGGMRWETPTPPPPETHEVDVTRNLHKIADDPRQKAYVQGKVQEMISKLRLERAKNKPRS